MSNSDLLSREWCDLVFEGRNQKYGAYRIRRNMGRRYAFALLVVGGMVVLLTLGGVALRLWMEYDRKEALEELEDVLPKLARMDAEQDHVLKSVATGRPRPPRLQRVEGGVAAVPEIVEVTKQDIRFGIEEEQMQEDGLPDIAETFEELDSLHALQEDLPLEGPHLLPTEVVEEMPQFPGGIGALMKWLDEHVAYPPNCVRMKIGGQLEVNFLVEVDGRLTNARIVHSLHPDLDRAVLNAIRRMPRWTPGRVNGRVSVVSMTLPVRFTPR